MKVRFIAVGKTEKGFIEQGFVHYERRIIRYIPFSMHIAPSYKGSKSVNVEEQRRIEGQGIMRHCRQGDCLVALDEKGATCTSQSFARFIDGHFSGDYKCLVFVSGGAYGLGEDVLTRADSVISFSRMTFTHQMIRLIFAEQLYRAMTIIRGEGYHH